MEHRSVHHGVSPRGLGAGADSSRLTVPDVNRTERVMVLKERAMNRVPAYSRPKRSMLMERDAARSSRSLLAGSALRPEEDALEGVVVRLSVLQARKEHIPVVREESVIQVRRQALLVRGEGGALHPLHDLLP